MAAEHEPDAPRGWRRRALQAAHLVEPEDETAEVIFGTLIGAVVFAIKARRGETGAGLFTSALLVLTVYWIAHVYADVLGERLRTHARPGWTGIVRVVARDWGMLRGSLIPVAVFGAVRLAGATVNAAALAALWVTVALLGCWGLVASVRGGARGWELVGETVCCAALGGAVLLLKIFIH